MNLYSKNDINNKEMADSMELHDKFKGMEVYTDLENEAAQYKVMNPTQRNVGIYVTLDEGIEMPEYQHTGDSGFDLCSPSKYLLYPGERVTLDTGIAVAIPVDTEIQVRSRSGLASKHGIVVLNSPGTVDSGYRGKIGVILYNTSKVAFQIEKGMRIAQAVLCPVFKAEFIPNLVLDKTERDTGGFGSTG